MYMSMSMSMSMYINQLSIPGSPERPPKSFADLQGARE